MASRQRKGTEGKVDDRLLNLLIPVIWESVEHAGIVMLRDSLLEPQYLTLFVVLQLIIQHCVGRSDRWLAYTRGSYLECADGQAE